MNKLLTFILMTISVSSFGQTPDTDKWHFKKYFSDSSTSKLAKKLFNDEKINIDNNNPLFLLDSLTAKDKQSRPFYFKVITNSYKSSDGYYSEGLGYAGKNYVENNTSEFANYFTDKTSFTKKELDEWVEIVMLEIRLVAENDDKDILTKMIKNINSNCKSCTPDQVKILSYFIEQLNMRWAELEKSFNK